MSGVKVSALTTPVNPENKPAESGPDGSFTLQVKHSGTFKLALENATCYEDFTTADITASADGPRDAGVIGLTARPEPTGTARYTFTPKGPPAAKKFKLTVNCVRGIAAGEFNASRGIIRSKAAAEGLGSTLASAINMITEISLPATLTTIGDEGFRSHVSVSGTLIIPNNITTIGTSAFQSLGVGSALPPAVGFESGSRLTAIEQQAFEFGTLRDFSLPENLETIGQRAFRSTGFDFSSTVPKTLIIPAKVSKIGNQAFAADSASAAGFTTVEILSDALRKPSPSAVAPFPLGDNLFQNRTGITEIILPRAVHDSYTAAERTAIFGGITLKPR